MEYFDQETIVFFKEQYGRCIQRIIIKARVIFWSELELFSVLSHVNLPGWRWAGIKQLALVGSSSSLHSEACKALGGSDGVIHSRISDSGGCVRADTNVGGVVGGESSYKRRAGRLAQALGELKDREINNAIVFESAIFHRNR